MMGERSLVRLLVLTVALSVCAYAIFAASFFPNVHGRLGHDYEYFLPLLLAGKYWIAENGVLAVPRFSPAFCGGLPFLANPQSIFYSLPQAISVVAGPTGSYLATMLISAGLGAGGTFGLLYRRFGVSLAAASVGSVIFLFNGFLFYRMVVGHVTYHVVGLLPLLCYLLLTPVETAQARGDDVARGAASLAGAATIGAYCVYAGAANVIVPIGIVCLIIWLIYSLAGRPPTWFWRLGTAAAVIAALASAGKLAPAVALIDNFPRPEPLRVFADFGTLLWVFVEGLFVPFFLHDDPSRHELEFGVGLVPPLLMVMGIIGAVGRYSLRAVLTGIQAEYWARLLALALLLALPIWLNLGGPEKAVWLKTLPYIGNNVLLLRWVLIYLLPLAVGAAMLLDFVFTGVRERLGMAILGILMTVLPALAADRGYYDRQPYDGSAITAADRALRHEGAVPVVTRIGTQLPGARNDGLIGGASSYPCYEPVFGYGLETLPQSVKAGELSRAPNGRYLSNPACYIYGGVNGCVPGAAFTAADSQEEAAFAAYRPFAYAVPSWQSWADWLSLLGLALILGGFCVALFSRWRQAASRAVHG